MTRKKTVDNIGTLTFLVTNISYVERQVYQVGAGRNFTSEQLAYYQKLSVILIMPSYINCHLLNNEYLICHGDIN